MLGDLEGDRRSMTSPAPFPFPTLPEAIVCQTFRLLFPRVFFPDGAARAVAASVSALLLFCRFSHSSLADSILFTSLVFFSTGAVAGFGVFLSVSQITYHGTYGSRFFFVVKSFKYSPPSLTISSAMRMERR
jgi:hypothetical protein